MGRRLAQAGARSSGRTLLAPRALAAALKVAAEYPRHRLFRRYVHGDAVQSPGVRDQSRAVDGVDSALRERLLEDGTGLGVTRIMPIEAADQHQVVEDDRVREGVVHATLPPTRRAEDLDPLSGERRGHTQ